MCFWMLAKATSGFIDLPAGRNKYSSSKAQTNLSFVWSQLESAPTGKGTVCFPLPLPLAVAVVFAPFADRWGPEERAIGTGNSVFCGTPRTWKDRD